MMNNINLQKNEIEVETEIWELFKRLISKEASLSEISIEDMTQFSQKYLKDCTFLYKLYSHVFKEHTETVYDNEVKVEISKIDSNYKIIFGEEEKILSFDRSQLLKFLTIAIDTLDKILPLGSVVDLKKEYFKKNLLIDQVENIRVVITHRFLSTSSNKHYFPYAGVIYPIGAPSASKYINFTTQLIESIIHVGFSDEQDEVYIFVMKQKLLEEMEMNSFSFATKDELELYQKTLRSEMEQDGW